MNLALFDFDGTITNKDMFTGFIFYSVKRKRIFLGLILLFPFILFYKIGILSPGNIRTVLVYFSFKGIEYSHLDRIGLEYSTEVIPNCIRQKALEQICWHKEQGDKIVVVSASLDIYLRHWCKSHNLDLICSTLDMKDGSVTGKLVSGDCSKKQKAIRIKNLYDIEKYETIYAYGDTRDDKEMLNLANIKYYRWERV